MAQMFKVVDRRSQVVAKVSNIPSQKEVVMSKVNAIVVKQVNPQPKEVVVKKQEPMFTLAQVQALIAQEVKKYMQPQEVVAKPQVYRVNAQTVQPVKVEEVQRNQHDAGIKAYTTRILKQQEVTLKEVARKYEPGVVVEVVQDKGTPMAKILKVKLDKVVGKVAFFRAKVTKKGQKDRYIPLQITF